MRGIKVFIAALYIMMIYWYTAHPAQAADQILCTNIYSGTIAASGSVSVSVSKGSEGFFSVQPVFTGTGTLKIDYQLSNNGATWSPAVQIVASAVSGTHYPYPSAGTNIFAGYQRIILTETGGANSVVISGVYRCAQ